MYNKLCLYTGQTLVVTVDLLQKFNKQVRENRRFTISLLSQKFLQVWRSVLYKTVTEQK